MADLHARLRTVRSRPAAAGEAVVREIRENDVPFMAGSIAYQAFVSLVPLLALLFLAVTVVGDQAFADRVFQMTEGSLPPNARELLHNAIAGGGEGAASASIIGLVTLLWGSLKIFRGLDKAFSEIYDTATENSIVDQLRDGALVLGVIAVTVAAMVVAGSLFAIFEGLLAQAVNLLVLVAGLTVAFLPMFRFFPDAELSWLDALPGALISAVGWTVLQFLFQLYVGASGQSDPSNVIGAIILLLTWLYFSGLVLLIGATVNAVLLGEAGSDLAVADESAGEGGADAGAGGASAGAPSPKTAPSDAGERLDGLAERLHRERERRQEAEREVERLERELAARDDERLTDLETRNRTLRRRLSWERKSLPIRVAWRLSGRTPAEPRDPAAD